MRFLCYIAGLALLLQGCAAVHTRTSARVRSHDGEVAAFEVSGLPYGVGAQIEYCPTVRSLDGATSSELALMFGPEYWVPRTGVVVTPRLGTSYTPHFGTAFNLLTGVDVGYCWPIGRQGCARISLGIFKRWNNGARHVANGDHGAHPHDQVQAVVAVGIGFGF